MRIFINKIILLFLMLPILGSISTIKAGIRIVKSNSSYTIIDISIDSVEFINKKVGNESYQQISIDGFSSLHRTGFPLLAYRGINIAANATDSVTVTILEQSSETIKNINIYPSPEIAPAVANEDNGDIFTKNDSIYLTNSFYPNNIIQIMSRQIFRETPITTMGIMPVQYNPVTKELKVYKKIKAKISYSRISSSRASSITANGKKIVSNIVTNPSSLPSKPKRSGASSDYGKDIVIFTVNAYEAAAETLAVWHKMKGYDVEIKYKDSWSKEDVAISADSFYNNTTPKPGYMLIIGDGPNVKPGIAKGDFYQDRFAADLYFGCMNGSDDYMPEMARGRISVSNKTEAMNTVKKIINYEKKPPHKNSFYKNVIGASFFQDNKDIYTQKYDGVEDRAFVETIEYALLHLDTLGYDFTRIYTRDKKISPSPTNWSGSPYNTGGVLPSYLKQSNSWDGTTKDILDKINNGCFLVTHYDHGNTDGWHAPSFKNADINSLTNDTLLPLIYSIDCYVGKFFNYYGTTTANNAFCFAEKVLRKAKGGAVGIIAASRTSYSGPNDALHYGLIDATWPGLIHRSGQFPNPTITEHEPVYIIGDILDQGLFRMTETWPDFGSWKENKTGIKLHFEMYHYFGDPTTRLWTDIPKTVCANLPDTIAVNASDFSLKNVNAIGGIVTLYDKKSGTVVGKHIIENSNFSIPIVNPLSPVGNSATLTITGQNFRPFIKDVFIGDKTGAVSIKEKKFTSNPISIKIINSKLIINTTVNQSANLNIFDIKGRCLLSKSISGTKNSSGRVIVNLSEMKFSSGVYIVNVYTNSKHLTKKIKL